LIIIEKVENKNYFSIINHFWLKKGTFLPLYRGGCKNEQLQNEKTSHKKQSDE
jgi:hypothetical protein